MGGFLGLLGGPGLLGRGDGGGAQGLLFAPGLAPPAALRLPGGGRRLVALDLGGLAPALPLFGAAVGSLLLRGLGGGLFGLAPLGRGLLPGAGDLPDLRGVLRPAEDLVLLSCRELCALPGGLASVILLLCHSISSYTQK